MATSELVDLAEGVLELVDLAEEVLELVDLAAGVMEVEDLGEVVTEFMEEGLVWSTQERDRKLQKEVQGEPFYLLQVEEQDPEALEHLLFLRQGFLAGRLVEQGGRLPKCQVWACLESTKGA